MQNISNEKTEDKAEEMLIELGLLNMTKLEKLAKSFSGVKYEISPDKHNPETGYITFIYNSPYINKRKTAEEIENAAEKFYDKNDYIIFSTESENGFEITIWDNFITKSFLAF